MRPDESGSRKPGHVDLEVDVTKLKKAPLVQALSERIRRLRASQIGWRTYWKIVSPGVRVDFEPAPERLSERLVGV